MGTSTNMARRLLLGAFFAVTSVLTSGCAATSVLTFAYEQANDGQCISAGCAASAVLSYAIEKANEGQPTPCHRLNSVERALSPRCGPYQAGSLGAADVSASGLPRCPLSLAARDPQLWPVLPELLAKGASPERCEEAPLVALAQAQPCPDFSAASPEALTALRWLAEGDAHAVQHDVVRMLSCPNARVVGLNSVLDGWLAQGQLPTRGLTFAPLAALHPSMLGTTLSQAMEAQGHSARASLGSLAGLAPSSFDSALRDGDRFALDWWLDRVPELANRVPARQRNQLPWLPLARVITPNYLAHPEQQGELVGYLLSRGADPWRSLPHDPRQSVVSYARQLKSPSLELLDPPAGAARVALRTERVAGTATAAGALPAASP